MKYCAKCGTQVQEDMMQCPACGAAMPVLEKTDEEPIRQEALVETEIQKPNKKKVWLWITLSAVLVLAIAAAVWFFFLRKETPEKKEFVLSDAVEACRVQLNNLTADAENFHNVFNAATEQVGSKELSLTVSGTADLGAATKEDVKTDIVVQFDFCADSSVIGGDLKLDVQYGANNATFDIDFALNDESLQIAAPDLVDDVLELNLADKEELRDGGLGKIKDFESLITKEEADRLLEKLIDSIQPESQSEEKVMFGAEERQCTVYTIAYDREILKQLLNAVSSEAAKAYEKISEQVKLIVCEEQVVGITVQDTKEKDAPCYKILLCGKENPWSDVRFYTDDEENGNIVTELTEKGFETVITDTYEASEVRILCDDEARKLTIEDRNEGTQIVIYYQLEDDEVVLRFEQENGTPITIKIAPMQRIPEILSESAADVEQMNDMELAMLLMSALKSLKDNPQTTWIYDLLTDSSGLSL